MLSVSCVVGSYNTWPTAGLRHLLHNCLSLKLGKSQVIPRMEVWHFQKHLEGNASLPSGIFQMECRASRAGRDDPFPFASAWGGGSRVQGIFPPPRDGAPATGAGVLGQAVAVIIGGGAWAIGGGGPAGGRFSVGPLAGVTALERFPYFAAVTRFSSSRRAKSSSAAARAYAASRTSHCALENISGL